MRALFVLEKGFYSAHEKAIIVLIKYFDLLYNDDYLVGDRAIIIALSGW